MYKKYKEAWLQLKHIAESSANDVLYSEMDRIESNLGI